MPTSTIPASEFKTRLLAFVRKASELHDRAFARGLRKARQEAEMGKLHSYQEIFGTMKSKRGR